jgi:primary-amine oxidase
MHPLDPLAAGEIAACTAALRAAGALPESAVVVSIELDEPEKAEVRRWPSYAPPRIARATVVGYEDGVTSVARVDLAAGSVIELAELPGRHAALNRRDEAGVPAAVLAHPVFVEGLRRRGLGPDAVEVGLFVAGNVHPERWPGRRLVRTSLWLAGDAAHQYTRPVEGLVAIVDVATGEVLEAHDHGEVPVPPPSVPAGPPYRDPLRGLEIVQPAGPSFTRRGRLLAWDRWSLRVGFSPREGLVLHDVRFDDRPVLWRASFSEMWVPYASDDPGHADRGVFDIGEGLLGLYANGLHLGCDCLGVIEYIDADVSDAEGRPVTIPNAICIHEEDEGILWKHTDRDGHAEVRRSRRLVVSWIATLDNYDYGFYWYLRQDGSIEAEVKATGIPLVRAAEPGAVPADGPLVAPQLVGMLHQHFFNVRLDMSVDGDANAVEELEALPAAGGAFRTSTTLLADTEAARRSCLPARGRCWRIVNRTRRGALGQHPAYRLEPGGNVESLTHPDAQASRRAGFARHHLWVTPYHHDQRYAAGDWPNLSGPDEGLPAYAAGRTPVVDRDIVVWYTFGLHHLPRPEEWPVMPVAKIGFALRPDGFFDRNPAADLPPPHR